MTRDRLLAIIVFSSLFVKLTLSPWAFGEDAVAIIKNINYLTDAVILICGIYLTPVISKEYTFIYVFFGLSVIVLLISGAINETSTIDAFLYLLKIYLPILYLAILMCLGRDNYALIKHLSKYLAYYTFLLLTAGVLFLPKSYNRFEYWWPSYFGGLHTTAYSAVALFFVCYTLLQSKVFDKKSVIILGGGIVLAVSLGWGVRTALISWISFLALSANYEIQKHLTFFKPIFLFILPLLILTFYFFIDESLVNEVSSGRVSMYTAKMTQLANNSYFTWLFGNGFGSDLIETTVWNSLKGAHNDYITFIVEGGLLFLILTLLMLLKLFLIQTNRTGRYLLISFLLTSLFSNGMIVRPIPSYLFFTAIALIGLISIHSSRGADCKCQN